MPNSENVLNVNVTFDRSDKEKFDRLYSKELFKLFLRRSVSKAIQSKDFFDEVFFYFGGEK